MRRPSPLVACSIIAAAAAVGAAVGHARVPPALAAPHTRARACARTCVRARTADSRPPRQAVARRSPQGGGLRPLPAPSARHPLTILSVGDSLGEDLGFGLADVLSADPHVRVVLDAVGSTGLADVAYYDWASHLRQDLASAHPALVVAMLGGNDAVSFDQGDRYAAFGSMLWRQLYGARVHALMREARDAGARVVWVGMPVMAPGAVLSDASMRTLDALYRREAARLRGVVYVSTWRLLQAPGGGYTAALRTRSGALEVVRDPDGVHIAPPAGDALVATAVVAAINRTDGLGLCLSPDDLWQGLGPATCPAVASVSGDRGLERRPAKCLGLVSGAAAQRGRRGRSCQWKLPR